MLLLTLLGIGVVFISALLLLFAPDSWFEAARREHEA